MSSSVSVGSSGVHKVLFEPSECLWWVWGLILNAIFAPPIVLLGLLQEVTFSKRTCATHWASQVCFIDYTKAFDCVDHNKLWKILKEMGIPDHLTCSLRNLYAGQEATVRTGHGTTDWFQIGKGVHQGCILSPCLFNLYAEYIMQNARLDEA